MRGARDILAKRGAVVTGGHFVYTAGDHGAVYVNKDAVYPYTNSIRQLGWEIALLCMRSGVEAVVGAEKGGIIMAQWVAHALTDLTSREIPAVYAEYMETVLDRTGCDQVCLMDTADSMGVQTRLRMGLDDGDKVIIRKDKLHFKRGQDRLLREKVVLVVEDVINTGKTVRLLLAATRLFAKEIVGVSALCNRGGITAEDLGVPTLQSLMDVTLEKWPEADCPLCRDGVPVNIDLGKGAAFLARKVASQ